MDKQVFPEHHFTPNDFKLHIGNNGQICDSKEELMIHNFLIGNLKNVKVKRESIRLLNNEANETYIPDWIIEQEGSIFIVEYFGLFNSNRFPGYTEKVKRKMEFYTKLDGYITVAIFPEDYRKENYSGIVEVLGEAGLLIEKLI